MIASQIIDARSINRGHEHEAIMATTMEYLENPEWQKKEGAKNSSYDDPLNGWRKPRRQQATGDAG